MAKALLTDWHFQSSKKRRTVGAQMPPKIAQDGSKLGPRQPKGDPRWPKRLPSLLQDEPPKGGQNFAVLAPTWGILELFWGNTGGVLDTSEAILEPSWGRSGAPRNCHPKSTLNNATTRSSLAILEPAGGQLESFLGYFGATLDQSWSHIMAIWEPAEAILEPSRSRKTIVIK